MDSFQAKYNGYIYFFMLIYGMEIIFYSFDGLTWVIFKVYFQYDVDKDVCACVHNDNGIDDELYQLEIRFYSL